MGEQASTIRRKGLLLTRLAVTIGQAASRQAPNYWARCKPPGKLLYQAGCNQLPAAATELRAATLTVQPGCTHPAVLLPKQHHALSDRLLLLTTTDIYSNCPT